MDIELINLAYNLADEIKNNEDYIRYNELEKFLINNYKDKIDELDLIKKDLNILYKYSNEYKSRYQEFLKLKEFFYGIKEFKEYKKLERNLDELLGKINKEIANSISLNVNFYNEFGMLI